jgi:hypothetical protein
MLKISTLELAHTLLFAIDGFGSMKLVAVDGEEDKTVGYSKQDQLKIYFRIDKDLIHTGDWAKLSKAAKSVYPVIGRHLNKRGETWVSLETIAREAGTTRQRASRGMRELKEKLSGFEYKLWIDESTKKAYMYKHQPLPQDHPNTVRFHREIVDEGHWKELSPAAQSVYIAMRGLANKVQKNEESWLRSVGKEGLVTFKVPYAYVYATKTKIAKLAGVDSSSRRINSYLQELVFASLINYLDWNYNKKGQCIPRGKKWKVYLLPVYSPALIDQVVGVSPQERNRAFHNLDRDQARNSDQKETGHFVTSEEGILKHDKGHFVTESSQSKKSNRRSLSNIINNTINTKCGSTEIPQSESSLDPGDPGSLTSRSDAPVRGSETPVRENLANHITTDWNKRDCQQCMYRDNDDGTEYCTMAFSDQGATIGEMEYCPLDG